MRSRFLCTLLAAAVTAVCATTAAAATHVYVSVGTNYRIDEFAIGQGGVLNSLGDADAGNYGPWYMAMTSNAKHLYVNAYGANHIEALDVAPNGILSLKDKNHGGEAATGTGPVGLALSPDNRNAYVANYDYNGAGTISIYDIAPNGTINAHSPDHVAEGTGAYGVAVSRDGKSVYDASQDGYIYEFDRAAGGGLAAKKPTGSVSARGYAPGAPTEPTYLALTPDGRHLYSANYKDESIGVFDVASNGTLTEKPAGQSPVTAGSQMYEIAVSPNGKSLYAASGDGVVYQYNIGPGGGLTKKSPWTVASAGTYLGGVWLSPNGLNAYVVDGNPNHDVAQFNVDALGRLTAKSPKSVNTGAQPAAAVVTPSRSPLAAFSASRGLGLTEKFDASASRDPDGLVARYVWRFGDGGGPVTAGPKPKHTYKHAGTYTVRLTVFDKAGCSVQLVWTGQTAYCSGNPAATVTHAVTIPKP